MCTAWPRFGKDNLARGARPCGGRHPRGYGQFPLAHPKVAFDKFLGGGPCLGGPCGW
jgi:hypothetical protein